MERPLFTDLDTAPRLLLGPGPSMVPARVLRAMATPLLGHLDPQFLQIMEEEQRLLRYLFQTTNEVTLAIPGTGTAGMEAALCNLIEPGDRVLVAVMGFFGERLYEMAMRYGAHADRLECPWGQVFEPEAIAATLQGGGYKLLALVHAETSTGALQPGIAEIARAAHAEGTLLVLDTVTSLAGLPVDVDAWGVDVAYSATQKGLSCPPGLAPITFSPARIGSPFPAEDPGRQLVPGLERLAQVLGSAARLPPHLADQHSLCPARRPAPRRRGRPGSTLRPSPFERRAALAGVGSIRLVAAGPDRIQAADPDHAPAQTRYRRCRLAQALVGRL